MSALETSLNSFGVTRSLLSTEQVENLDRNGFVALEGALDEVALREVARRVDELVATEGARAGTEFKQEAGTDRLANLVDKGAVFDNCWNYPLQLAAVAHVLSWREFKLTSLNTRSALPNQGRQGLHVDWAEAVAPGDYQICNSVWMLDDFTEENGATRAVPGSHRFGRLPKDVMEDPTAPHPDEVLILGSAGTCVVFNSHLWHSGTTNRSGRPRRGLHAAFILRHHSQQTSQRSFLRPETVERMSAGQRYLLDV